jgi:hypothetical protein
MVLLLTMIHILGHVGIAACIILYVLPKHYSTCSKMHGITLMNVKQHAFLAEKIFSFPSFFAQRCSNSIAICKFTLCSQMIDLAEKEEYSISRENKVTVRYG